MFRAPFDSFFTRPAPPLVDQLLSEDSLHKTGWFDIEQVGVWRRRMLDRKLSLHQRSIIQLGMVGVVATQLWYHTFVESSLADLPGGWRRPVRLPASRLAGA